MKIFLIISLCLNVVLAVLLILSMLRQRKREKAEAELEEKINDVQERLHNLFKYDQ